MTLVSFSGKINLSLVTATTLVLDRTQENPGNSGGSPDHGYDRHSLLPRSEGLSILAVTDQPDLRIGIGTSTLC